MELQRNLDGIRRRGLGLVAISYDPVETLKAFADRYGIEYPLLSDVGSETIRGYGLLNTAATGDQAGIPHPGTFVVDRKGRVVERFFEGAYQERFTANSILVQLDGPQPGGAGGRTITTPHLSVSVRASDAVVAPGERFSLVLDVVPGPGMHVYAPGQTGYIPMTFKVAQTDAYELHPIRYPEAETYLFKPLNERVKVYQKPVRLVQDVTLSLSPDMRARAAAEGATLSIVGTLQYQACDDAVCYLPTDVPLEWTLHLTKIESPERRR